MKLLSSHMFVFKCFVKSQPLDHHAPGCRSRSRPLRRRQRHGPFHLGIEGIPSVWCAGGSILDLGFPMSQYLTAHLIPRASMLDIPFSSRYQAEMKKELFIDGVPELLLLRLLVQNEMYGYELVAKIHSISDGAFGLGRVAFILSCTASWETVV